MNRDKVYGNSTDQWSKNRGIGTISYSTSLDIFKPVCIILNKYFDANPTSKVVVAIPVVSDKELWATSLVKDFKHFDKLGTYLVFLTADQIIVDKSNYSIDLIIFHNIDRFIEGERAEIVKQKYIKFKYILGVTNTAYPDKDGFLLSHFCPVVSRVTKADVITHGLTDGVVEFNVGVSFNEADQTSYNGYSEFIKDTMNMYGSFENCFNCYQGDRKNGISADHFRNQIAMNNGWDSTLDLSSEYYRNIDRFYNPNNIYERVKTFTEVIKKRQYLTSDNVNKLPKLVEIIKQFPDKKILIINKRSGFARLVCDYINTHVQVDTLKKDVIAGNLFKVATSTSGSAINSNFTCVEYHTDVQSRPLLDGDGEYIRIKTGNNKGAIKQFGTKSLNGIANQRFNEDYHNVISSNNAIPKEGSFDIDIIIITSPDCNTMSQIQYRVANLTFKNGVKIINLYMKSTKDHKKLNEKQALTNNKVIPVNTINEIIL